MQVKYQVGGSAHTFDPGTSDDLGDITRSIEAHLKESHPELAGRRHLTERVTDGLLNALADDSTEVELGDLSS